MNQIALIPRTPAGPPAMPAELAVKISSFDGMEIIRGQVPAIVVDQAKAQLVLLDRYHAAPPPERIELWCLQLRGALAPIEEQDFQFRVSAIMDDCGDLPGWCWTMETLSAVRRTTRYFPTSYDVNEILRPIANKGLRGRAQVRLLALAAPAQPETTTEAVQALPGRFLEGVGKSVQPPHVVPLTPKPQPKKPVEVKPSYAEGEQLAAIRAAALLTPAR